MARYLARLGAILLAGGVLAAFGLIWLLTAYNRPGPADRPTTVVVEPGTPVSGIARQLAQAGVVADRRAFDWGWRLFGGDRTLQAGEYRFPPGSSAASAAARLAQGETVVHRLTVPAGLTRAAVARLVRAESALRGDITSLPAEGRLLPDTYHYSRGDRRQALIRRMRAAMTAYLDRTVPGQLDDLPLGDRQAVLTLASIVQREAASRAEQPLVASVFINRLRAGMRLQADATVIYALTQGEGRLGRQLTRADWDIESPYNTYRHGGLPPGPIANPGRSSVKAVVTPAQTPYRYFVGDGTGHHLFAKTLQQHNRNIVRLKANSGPVPRRAPRLKR